MEGQATGLPTQTRGTAPVFRQAARSRSCADSAADREETQSSRGGHLVLIALLLLVAIGLRFWLISHTEVAARDSIGYIRLAWQFRHHSWTETIRGAQQHPGYPLAILATSEVLRSVYHRPEPILMQRAAQLVSATAGILLVFPMYFLGCAMFHRGVAFWATLLFQVLPASGRVLADGLSEGIFLLFATLAFLAAAHALRRHSALWSGLTGLFGGISYLIRPEGAFLIAATGTVLVGMQFVGPWRTTWRRLVACAASLTLTALAVSGPLIAVTGELTVKATPKKVVADFLAFAPDLADPTLVERGSLVDAVFGNPGGMPSHLAAWYRGDAHDGPQARWAIFALVREIIKSTFYLVWLPMLVGLWWFRDRFRLVPVTWVTLLVTCAILFCLWRVGARMGYVSDRHTLLVLLCGCFWAAAGTPVMLQGAYSALRKLVRRWQAAPTEGLTPDYTTIPLWCILVMSCLVATMLPKAVEPLHANRAGFRHAGLWLAQQANPWDEVIDPYCWSNYYAGKVFHECDPPSIPPHARVTKYVVREMSGNEHSRLPLLQNAIALCERGTPVFRWTGKRDKETVDVLVYAIPPDRLPAAP